jgi:hypothetical protein
MQKVRFVGLDVHKESIAIAVADSDGSAPQDVATIPNDTALVLKRLRKLQSGGTLKCCYEAGPTGFILQRALVAAGIECVVVAPSLVPKMASDRVKTDRRDALKLSRFLRSGDLTEVHVPDAATEAMRDLERCRDDAKRAERTVRHQLSKFLLRHGRKYDGKTAWTGKHLDWVRSQVFEHEAHNRVLVDSVHAVESATARVEQLTKDIVELIESWSLRPLAPHFEFASRHVPGRRWRGNLADHVRWRDTRGRWRSCHREQSVLHGPALCRPVDSRLQHRIQGDADRCGAHRRDDGNRSRQPDARNHDRRSLEQRRHFSNVRGRDQEYPWLALS